MLKVKNQQIQALKIYSKSHKLFTLQWAAQLGKNSVYNVTR